jgi:hypothetical protein
MSLIKKNFVMYCVVFFVLPIIIIIFFEILLASLSYLTGSKYFEDRLETHHRTVSPLHGFFSVPGVFRVEGGNANNQHRTKVAVFGGSSSAGYASPISFSELLGSNEFSGKNLEVHNYARNGEPFVGFQAELLKAVMPDYDVFVVYAGHNEIWQQIYSRARISHETIVLPNGARVPFGSAPYLDLDRRLKRIQSSATVLSDPAEKVLGVLNWVADRSRLFWLANRVVSKISEVIPGRDQDYLPKYYYDSEFISPAERTLLVEEYKQTVNEIAGRLKADQTLILSTVMANNFFPPLAEVTHNKNPVELFRYEAMTKKGYARLAVGDFPGLKSVISNLPQGAHKTYLESRLCFGKEGFKNLATSSCFALTEEARRIDKLPYRVVPEINQFIRSYKARNVIVVDPESRFKTDVDGLNKYFEYFVDFQHPSPKGHLVIADAVLTGLFSDYQSQSKALVDECGNITLQEEPKLKVIKSNPVVQAQQFEINIAWLDNFIAAQPSPSPYDYFKDRALAAKSSCKQRAQ